MCVNRPGGWFSEGVVFCHCSELLESLSRWWLVTLHAAAQLSLGRYERVSPFHPLVPPPQPPPTKSCHGHHSMTSPFSLSLSFSRSPSSFNNNIVIYNFVVVVVFVIVYNVKVWVRDKLGEREDTYHIFLHRITIR